MFKKFGICLLLASIVGLTLGCSPTPKGPVKAEKTGKKVDPPVTNKGKEGSTGIE